MVWQLTHKLWIPILKALPKPLWENWLPLVPAPCSRPDVDLC